MDRCRNTENWTVLYLYNKFMWKRIRDHNAQNTLLTSYINPPIPVLNSPHKINVHNTQHYLPLKYIIISYGGLRKWFLDLVLSNFKKQRRFGRREQERFGCGNTREPNQVQTQMHTRQSISSFQMVVQGLKASGCGCSLVKDDLMSARWVQAGGRGVAFGEKSLFQSTQLQARDWSYILERRKD